MTGLQITLLLLGMLGALLTGGALLGLCLEVARRRPHRWPTLLASGAVYLALFVTEPPAMLSAAYRWQAVESGLALRSFALGLFLALLTRAYIRACGPE